MKFTWDAGKSLGCFRERGFDFAFATHVFDGFTVQALDVRREYGEQRTIALGRAEGVCLTVVFTDRTGDACEPVRRIISARRSNTRERRAYDQTIDQAQKARQGPGELGAPAQDDGRGSRADVAS